MSISAEKLSELLSFYQRISAFTLGGPAAVHGCMMGRPLGASVGANTFILPAHRTPTYGQSMQIQGPQIVSACSSVKEQITPMGLTSQALDRPGRGLTERRTSLSVTANFDQDEVDAEMLLFEGESIPAFPIGGERRLYMPMLLSRLLQRGFNDQTIQSACENLKIHFQEASNEQVDALRRALKMDVPRCGLIKRSDAERLWSYLDENAGKNVDSDVKPNVIPPAENSTHVAEDPTAPPSSLCSPVASSDSSAERFNELPTPNSFKVYHACFGKQKGIFVPEWYTAPDARCIVCVCCGVHSSTERFVSHVHRATAENNVAHWGFDPAKWRAYLLLAKDQRTSKELRDYFESLKCKFDASRKRKVCSVALANSQQQQQPASIIASSDRLLTIAGTTCNVSTEAVKKPRLVTNGIDRPLPTSACRLLPQTDFHEVPANFTLPAESVTIAQAALANARACSSTSSVPTLAAPEKERPTAPPPAQTQAQLKPTTAAADSTLSSVFVDELQAPQEAHEAEMKTIHEIVNGRVMSEIEKTEFLAEAAASRRRQLAMLSGVMYENVLLKQQLKTTKESSERAIAAFACENEALRNDRRKMETELAQCHHECSRLREELCCFKSNAVKLEVDADAASAMRNYNDQLFSSDQKDNSNQLESCTSVGAYQATASVETETIPNETDGGEDEQNTIDVVRFEDISTDEDSPPAADANEPQLSSSNSSNT